MRLSSDCSNHLLAEANALPDAIIYYAPQIFTQIGLSGNSFNLLATGVVGIINILSTILTILFLDRWVRLPVLLIGAVGMGLFAVGCWDAFRGLQEQLAQAHCRWLGGCCLHLDLFVCRAGHFPIHHC